jgi:RNA polymerase sigma-70 factor (ECF subfamily)
VIYPNAHNSAEPAAAAQTTEELLAECQQELSRFFTRRLRNRQEVKDFVQEVYVRFLQVPQRELVRQPLAYLYRIAANLVHDSHQRDRQGRLTYDSEIVDQMTDSEAHSGSDDLGDRIDAERQVRRVLAQLPSMYQAVLLLRKRDGLSSTEIARKLGISHHTAEKYLYRAIAHFRAADWHR